MRERQVKGDKERQSNKTRWVMGMAWCKYCWLHTHVVHDVEQEIAREKT